MKGDGFAQRYVDGLERKRGSTEKETEGGEKMKQLWGVESKDREKGERIQEPHASLHMHCTCLLVKGMIIDHM